METIWDSHLNEKLRILADAAKYDAAALLPAWTGRMAAWEQAMQWPVVSVIVFLQTEDAFLC